MPPRQFPGDSPDMCASQADRLQRRRQPLSPTSRVDVRHRRLDQGLVPGTRARTCASEFDLSPYLYGRSSGVRAGDGQEEVILGTSEPHRPGHRVRYCCSTVFGSTRKLREVWSTATPRPSTDYDTAYASTSSPDFRGRQGGDRSRAQRRGEVTGFVQFGVRRRSSWRSATEPGVTILGTSPIRSTWPRLRASRSFFWTGRAAAGE